jgi:urea carboxylase
VIYDEPIFRPLGDCYLAVEFGDEADLALNFRVLALEKAIDEQKLPGVIEVVPTFRTLGLILDRVRTSHRRVEEAVRSLLPEVEHTEYLPSRRFLLPVWYDDPWSAQIAERYGVGKNIDFVAEQNELTVEQVIEHHTGTDFWLVCVGFTPGCYFSYPLDASKALVAPKYKIPRDYTPARMLALAGFSTGAYPVASPGGYQLLGRLAVNIYEASPRNKAFPPDGVLFRAGDRHRYRSVSPLEYDEIWEQVQRGEYEYEIYEELFDVRGYLESRPPRHALAGEAAFDTADTGRAPDTRAGARPL